jgi:hypothetical protein
MHTHMLASHDQRRHITRSCCVLPRRADTVGSTASYRRACRPTTSCRPDRELSYDELAVVRRATTSCRAIDELSSSCRRATTSCRTTSYDRAAYRPSCRPVELPTGRSGDRVMPGRPRAADRVPTDRELSTRSCRPNIRVSCSRAASR